MESTSSSMKIQVWWLGLVFGVETGSYLRLIDSCITWLKAQGPSRTCNESNEEEEEVEGPGLGGEG